VVDGPAPGQDDPREACAQAPIDRRRGRLAARAGRIFCLLYRIARRETRAAPSHARASRATMGPASAGNGASAGGDERAMPHAVECWEQSDLVEVVRLLDEASPVDRFQVDQVREAVFDDLDLDPALLLCVRVGGRIVGAAAALVRPPRGSGGGSGPVGFLKLLAVHPEMEGQGIGSALLAEAERRLADRQARAVRIFGDAPYYLRPGVDFRLTRLVCLLQRRGYTLRGHAVNMEVDLADADLDTAAEEERLQARGIQVRRLELADAAAFQAYMSRHWSWNWTIEASRTLRRRPISTHIALRDGRIVGFACAGASGPGQFGPMGVQPELRRLGIGAVLLKRCLADLRDQGFPTADIQWVGPIAFYARQVGAEITRCFWQFEKPL
jgi:mycothiol synthase